VIGESLDPLIARMLDTGKFRSIAQLGDLWRSRTGQDPMLVAVTVNETWAKEHPLVARRFVAAVKESIEYLRTHPEVWPELARSVGHAYAAEVVKTLGEASGMPKQVPAGTFDLSYAP